MTAATSGTEVEPLLQIEGLRVEFVSKLGTVRAVDGISYAVAPGETLAVVGESGCGKSVTALSVIGLVPSPPGVVTAGEIRFAGEDLRSVDAIYGSLKLELPTLTRREVSVWIRAAGENYRR